MDKNKKHIHLGVFLCARKSLYTTVTHLLKLILLLFYLYNTLGFRAFLQFPVL